MVLISYVHSHSAYKNENYENCARTLTSPLAVSITASFASLMCFAKSLNSCIAPLPPLAFQLLLITHMMTMDLHHSVKSVELSHFSRNTCTM